jgi:hypothetical protein
MRESPPRIETHLVESDRPPTGLGEIPVPPAVSAIANAVSALTGRRVRKLPIRLVSGGDGAAFRRESRPEDLEELFARTDDDLSAC